MCDRMAPELSPSSLWRALPLLPLVATACGGLDPVAAADAAIWSDAAHQRPEGGVPDGSTAPDAAAGPVRYPHDQLHSPLPPAVVDTLRGIAQRRSGPPDRLIKVGDSITVSAGFLHCFADPSRIDLAGRAPLQATIGYFSTPLGDGTTSFDRASIAAGVGWQVHEALEGQPSRLDRELDAVAPAYAVVMYGSNDTGIGALQAFGKSLSTIVDRLLERGVIPILYTIPPRLDWETANRRVPLYNAVVRALAQTNRVPLIDFNRALAPLPHSGLSNDGVHPSCYGQGYCVDACVFSAQALQHGYNLRNLLTLEALHRVRLALAGQPPLSPAPQVPGYSGAGTAADPMVVDRLPFAVRGDTRGQQRLIDSYPGCDRGQDESGPELRYRIELAGTAELVALVLVRGQEVDVDLHLLDEAGGCIARHDRELRASLAAGRYTLVVDTYVSGGVERAGAFTLVVATR